MTTIICHDCQHIVLIRVDGMGFCPHCHAWYKVTIEQVRGTDLDEETLKDRVNTHRG